MDDLIFKVIDIDVIYDDYFTEFINEPIDIDDTFDFSSLKSFINSYEESSNGYFDYNCDDGFGEVSITLYSQDDDEICTIKFQVSIYAEAVEKVLEKI